MKKDKKKYNLRVDEDQLEVIMNSLEMWSRLYIGQLEVYKMPPLQDYIWFNTDISRDKIDYHLNEVKRLIWKLPPHASSRAVDKDKKGDYSYKIYKQMRHHLEKDEMKEKGKEYRTNVHSRLPYDLEEDDEIFIESVDLKVQRRDKLNQLK